MNKPKRDNKQLRYLNKKESIISEYIITAAELNHTLDPILI